MLAYSNYGFNGFFEPERCFQYCIRSIQSWSIRIYFQHKKIFDGLMDFQKISLNFFCRWKIAFSFGHSGMLIKNGWKIKFTWSLEAVVLSLWRIKDNRFWCCGDYTTFGFLTLREWENGNLLMENFWFLYFSNLKIISSLPSLFVKHQKDEGKVKVNGIAIELIW